MISSWLRELLVCPVELGELEDDEAASRLVCLTCGRRYPVEDGIPVMMVDRAEGGPVAG